MEAQSHCAGPQSRPSPGKSVLVVEDNRELRELLVDLLESDGYQVSAAENGEEALEKARLRRPELILLDLMMPVMNGWQFRERQLQDPSLSDVPVIVLSAFASNLDFAGYLPKPFRVADVLVAVHECVCGGSHLDAG